MSVFWKRHCFCIFRQPPPRWHNMNEQAMYKEVFCWLARLIAMAVVVVVNCVASEVIRWRFDKGLRSYFSFFVSLRFFFRFFVFSLSLFFHRTDRWRKINPNLSWKCCWLPAESHYRKHSFSLRSHLLLLGITNICDTQQYAPLRIHSVKLILFIIENNNVNHYEARLNRDANSVNHVLPTNSKNLKFIIFTSDFSRSRKFHKTASLLSLTERKVRTKQERDINIVSSNRTGNHIE